MNPFTVDWSGDTEEQLADIWTRHSADAQAITKAQDAIDRILEKDPLGKGQELSEGLRKIRVRPLTAYYSVIQAARIVKVDAIAYTL